MGAKKSTTAITVKSDTPAILEALDKKIASLKHIEDTVYKCNANLDGFGNIQQETKIENLIRAHSSVLGREKAYNEAARDLGLKTYPAFSISGGNAEQWKHDIQLRINIINHKETLDKLNSYKEKMSKFLSEQDQKAILMKEMAAELGME